MQSIMRREKRQIMRREKINYYNSNHTNIQYSKSVNMSCLIPYYIIIANQDEKRGAQTILLHKIFSIVYKHLLVKH